MVAQDLYAASVRDGLGLDYEIVRSIVIDSVAPRTDEERVVSNAFDIFRNAERFSLLDEPASAIESLQSKLIEGVSTKDGGWDPVAQKPIKAVMLAQSKSDEEYVDALVENLRNPYKWGPHPLCTAIMNADFIWVHRPFTRFNGFMEVLLRQLTFRFVDAPALSFFPLSHMRLNWELGLVANRNVIAPYGEAVIFSDYGIDSTPYLIQIIRFLEEGVRGLENAVSRKEEERSAQMDKVKHDCRLTYRQKEIARQMIEDPSFSIDVSGYQKRFDISLTTARIDLAGLVAQRYASVDWKGRKQVFRSQADVTHVR